jgi:hypothetical protein
MLEKNLEIVYVDAWDAHYVRLDGVVTHCGEYIHDTELLKRVAQLLGATVVERRESECPDVELNEWAGY